jgi:DNA-binding NarL/FixJ family response regulator
MSAVFKSLGFNVVACATDSRSALQAIQTQQPDVVTISASLRDGPLMGLAMLEQIRTIYPTTHPVLLLDSYNRDLIFEALRRGADGVICRDEPVESLCECIRIVNEGQVWVRSSELRQVLEKVEDKPTTPVLNACGERLLTSRQEEVVRLVSDGLSNREISQQLHLSEHTVKNYLHRIFDKLGLSTRVELILYILDRREPVGPRPRYRCNGIVVTDR